MSYSSDINFVCCSRNVCIYHSNLIRYYVNINLLISVVNSVVYIIILTLVCTLHELWYTLSVHDTLYH